MKKIVFLTGTRADYGKLKSLMKVVEQDSHFELHVFVTGMHMLNKYGSTYHEIEKDGFKNIYKYINQKTNTSDQMDITLSNTISGFSHYCEEIEPDLIVIHGDRLEALAGAIVGAFKNIKVIHIEGGEVSGTIDESVRHAVTKLAHFHLVSNEEAKKRILQLGEREDSVFVFGSPDLDIMYSDTLPTLDDVKKSYDFDFEKYSILMYHPVTTEIEQLEQNVENIIDAVIESNRNYIVIYPNNDFGSDIILNGYQKFKNNSKFRLYPSMRFEAFLTLLKNCDFIIGNSSSGIREACAYGKVAIDLGNRQKGRYDASIENILHCPEKEEKILEAIEKINTLDCPSISHFGEGNSDQKFLEIIKDENIWMHEIQKRFIDIDF